MLDDSCRPAIYMCWWPELIVETFECQYTGTRHRYQNRDLDVTCFTEQRCCNYACTPYGFHSTACCVWVSLYICMYVHLILPIKAVEKWNHVFSINIYLEIDKENLDSREVFPCKRFVSTGTLGNTDGVGAASPLVLHTHATEQHAPGFYSFLLPPPPPPDFEHHVVFQQ